LRYYELTISNADKESPNFGQVYKPGLNSHGSGIADGFSLSPGGVTFTSHPGGQIDTGALNIEFECLTYPFHTPQGGTWIRVWGVGLGMIGQATDFNPGKNNKPGAKVKLSAGMMPGLPLATAAYNAGQTGLLIEGTVVQAFGNCQGVNQTLELIINPSGLEPPSGFSFIWYWTDLLSTAIAVTLDQAMPEYKQDISISPYLRLPAEGVEAGFYDNLAQFASFLQEMTQNDGSKIYGEDYSGVQITIGEKTVYVFDNSTPPAPAKPLAFTDLIGQPTWLDPATISFKTMLRADLQVGDAIKLPVKGLSSPYVLTSPSAAFSGVPARDKSIFQGSFSITEVHHFANFRAPDADSWCTAFAAVPVPAPALLNRIVLPDR
jgi:hypothetical protein